jgi:molecular chaperone DnaK
VYVLGIDLGTTFTAAAVWRDGRAEICSLGTRAAAVPSVVLLRPDDSILIGEAANRRALIEPDRVAREFKRRFGDSTPVLLGGSPYSADALTAKLLASVVADVAAAEGGEPMALCISHPANWGSFKTDLLRQAVRRAALHLPVQYTTEPEAAAISYSQEQRLAVGETIAVYDLGGGTFDAAVLRRTPHGFTILGQPEGIERLGGIDIDAAVFNHVVQALGAAFAALDEDDPSAITAVARLRQECTQAKEALSSDTDVSIPVILPGVSTEVRLTRAELESMVRPALYDSIEAMKRALRSAGVAPDDLSAVLLVGGSSRMPLVAQMVGAELGRPIAVDVHPKHAVALGAAWLASGEAMPADGSPADGSPADGSPADGSPADGSPADGSPADGSPADTATGEVAPATRATPVAVSPAPAASASAPATYPAPAASSPAPVAGAFAAAVATPSARSSTPASGSVAPPPPVAPGPTIGAYQASAFQAPPQQQFTGAGTRYSPPSPDAGLPYPQQPASSGTQLPAQSPAAGLPFTAQPPGPGNRRALMAGVGALLLLGLAVVAGWTYLHGDPKSPVALTSPAPASPANSAASPSPSASGPAATVSAAPAAPPPAAPATGLVTVSFQGSGTVSGAVNCRGTCRLRLATGQTLRLHAEPATGFTFGRWTGCSGSSSRDCTVVVGSSSNVGVVFTRAIVSPAKTLPTTTTAVPTTSATASSPYPSTSTTPPTTSSSAPDTGSTSSSAGAHTP